MAFTNLGDLGRTYPSTLMIGATSRQPVILSQPQQASSSPLFGHRTARAGRLARFDLGATLANRRRSGGAQEGVGRLT
jgi:hypothetical protein